MNSLKYDCTCWGCTLPQWLPDSVLEIASEAYIIRHTVPVMRRVIRGGLHTCRDTPDAVLDELEQGWFESSDSALNKRIQQDAADEYKLRVLRQERNK